MKGVCVWRGFEWRASRGQAEEGCQRSSSSGAFQMLCKGCESILLKVRDNLSLRLNSPSVNKMPLSITRTQTQTHTHVDKQQPIRAWLPFEWTKHGEVPSLLYKCITTFGVPEPPHIHVVPFLFTPPRGPLKHPESATAGELLICPYWLMKWLQHTYLTKYTSRAEVISRSICLLTENESMNHHFFIIFSLVFTFRK